MTASQTIVGLLSNRALSDIHAWAAAPAAYALFQGLCDSSNSDASSNRRRRSWHNTDLKRRNIPIVLAGFKLHASETRIRVAQRPDSGLLVKTCQNSREIRDEIDRFEGTAKESDCCKRDNHDFCCLHVFDWNFKRRCCRKAKRPVHPV